MTFDSGRISSLEVLPGAGSTFVLHPVVITAVEDTFITKLLVVAPFSLQINGRLMVVSAAVLFFAVSTPV
jgi:hypothetical protein